MGVRWLKGKSRVSGSAIFAGISSRPTSRALRKHWPLLPPALGLL